VLDDGDGGTRDPDVVELALQVGVQRLVGLLGSCGS
jgi:hypothetical protein